MRVTLVEEPSSSSVLVDLEVGALVVKTKKLNKSRASNVALRWVRQNSQWTQFGMGFSPSEGMSLDESSPPYLLRRAGGGPLAWYGREEV